MSAADGGSFKPQEIEHIDWSGRVVMSDAARDVLEERRRQIESEGWTTDHDDAHSDGSLAVAGACYALSGAGWQRRSLVDLWPRSWSLLWLKRKDRRSDLVKAGALILAEIERLDREVGRTS